MPSNEITCPKCGGTDIQLRRDYDNDAGDLIGALIICKNKQCKQKSQQRITEDAYTTWSANNL